MLDIIVTGSVAFDQIANFKGRFKDYINPQKLHVINISFVVDNLRMEEGGTGGNISYNLTLLGRKSKLVASVGKDAKEYILRLKSVGVDVGGVKTVNIKTALGYVMTDAQDNQIWAFYKGAMDRVQHIKVKHIKTQANKVGPFVVISPNTPKAMIKYVETCIKNKWDYLYDPAFQIPMFSVTQLKRGISGAKIVIGNDYEIAQLKSKIKSKSLKINKDQIWITTLGSKGSIIEKGDEKFIIKPAKPKNLSDPTGAGDAYRAGFVAGFVKGLDLRVCGQMGSVSSVYTVEKYGTQTHKYSLKEFKKRYKFNYKKDLLY